jgi:hypothetical protein
MKVQTRRLVASSLKKAQDQSRNFENLNMNSSEQLKRLQDEFVSYVRARDDEGVRRTFRELLDAGCSRQEIVTKLLEASAETDQTSSTERDSKSEGADGQAPVNGAAQKPARPEPGSQNTRMIKSYMRRCDRPSPVRKRVRSSRRR